MKNSGISKVGQPVFVFVMLMLSYARSQEPMTAAKSGSADVLRDQIVTQERAGLDVLKTGELAVLIQPGDCGALGRFIRAIVAESGRWGLRCR
jgi:hypothetical protein